ncbi:hypothetical protein [Streptomyces lushanensis]|uniref:hypothetical protein n=1 Tax=Streptomyces lushanensis TaxID=1434255 RepID=UPI00082AF895|nr:hypothetical protein [Streptomyces lushanensis]
MALDTEGDIAPYSVAQYIAQIGGVVTNNRGVTVLTRVNGVAPRIANGKLNIAFPYNGDVRNVVPAAKLSGGATPDADLISAFQSSTSKACAQTVLIQNYGFDTIPHCGNIAVMGGR